MAEQKKSMDVFANYAILTVQESAANTLTFKKLETGISINEKVAWILNRIEYWVQTISVAMFNADQDALYYGISVSNSFAAPTITENAILDYNAITRIDIGAAASGKFMSRPFVKDFSSLPGGGILVPPTPFYMYAQGSGLTAVETVTARIHYTTLALSVDQYWELVEARRPLES